MKITKIEKQKKERTRYNIFIDGDFAFGLYDETILKFGLRTGDELEDKKIFEIREYDEFNYGKKVAYSFLSYRQRSKNELSKKLKDKKITEAVINKIIKLLEEQKYIDDVSYAKTYLETKIKNKPIGKKLMQNKFYEKGIDKDIAEKTLKENYSEEKEIDSAKKLFKKYSKKFKGIDTPEKKKKCYRYLISRGFDYEIVNRVVNIELNE